MEHAGPSGFAAFVAVELAGDQVHRAGAYQLHYTENAVNSPLEIPIIASDYNGDENDYSQGPSPGADQESSLQDWWPLAHPLRTINTLPIGLLNEESRTQRFGFYYLHRWSHPFPQSRIQKIVVTIDPDPGSLLLLFAITLGN